MELFNEKNSNERIVACSSCFLDQGLRLDAEKIGEIRNDLCPNCGSNEGKKLTIEQLGELAYRFFVWGSVIKCEYGAFPEIQYNSHQKTSIDLNENLEKDVMIFENKLGIGFFYYGPRAWMYGEIAPLKALLDKDKRCNIIKQILKEYPATIITSNCSPLYRIRNGKDIAFSPGQFDSPPEQLLGSGRLDSIGNPVLYTSPDLELCIHEMRARTEDELYVATLFPKSQLKLLNLSCILNENKNISEFESLDLAINMLFLAGKHAYKITREISLSVREAGFDGIIYPSYFSYIRNGAMPYQSALYGISNRRIPKFQAHEQSIMSQNIAIFGRPIQEGKVMVKSINRLMITNIRYNYLFGSVKPDIDSN